MNIEDLKSILAVDVKSALEEFEWAKAKVEIVFTFADSSSISLTYLNQYGDKLIPYYTDKKGRKSVKELPRKREINDRLSIIYSESITEEKRKWNKAEFIIYPNNSCLVRFYWDQQFFLDSEVSLARATVSTLFDQLYETISFKLLPEKQWKQATFLIRIIDQIADINCVVDLDGISQDYTVILPEKWSKYLIGFYNKTNNGSLKDIWPDWNIMAIRLRYGDYFNFNNDVTFSNLIY